MIKARMGVIAVSGFVAASVLALGCGDNKGGGASGDALSRLMDDGDVAEVAPALTTATARMTVPPRFCPNGDCTGSALAFWNLDDCNPFSTQLFDSEITSEITHPAFRAVSAACVASIDGQGVRLADTSDIIYAPDQPDFVFDQGLTVAAWINPDTTRGTQSVFRKRLDSSSSFVLAIDGGKLTFALRLTSGKTVGISTAIKAKRYTHVAATYDGKQALLYVNGAVATSANATGTIAPGAGPVFVGNDASGRELAGIVDDVWLNTLAAPATVVQGLACVHRAPAVALTPAATPAETAGTSVPFDLAITNTNAATCPADVFQAVPNGGYPLTLPFPDPVTVAPGQTVHLTLSVASSKATAVGSYPVVYSVFDQSADQAQATAQAVYLVGTGPVSCDGQPPASPQIIGSLLSPTGSPPGIYTYAATGLTAPTVTVLSNSDGTTQGLQISANPGASTDPNNAWVGFGMGFGRPNCVDASAYTGVQFTIAGDLGTCILKLELVPSENNSYMPPGVCTAGTNQCYGPFSPPVGLGTNVVNFADMAGGAPMPALDPSALNDIGWQLNVPTDGVTAPCVANFTVTDVSFVPVPATPPSGGGAGGAAGFVGHGSVGGAGGTP
jgi:hypothetical protein